MAASAVTVVTPGRGPLVFPNLSYVEITVVATATVYASGSGGMPVDLTEVLKTAAPSGWDGPAGVQALNPLDIVCVLPVAPSTNGFLASGFTLGTPTYLLPPGQSANDESANPGFLQTCPAWIGLWGTGAGNAQGLAQVANGAVTDTFTCLLVINRNGANN